MTSDDAQLAVASELHRATEKFGPFASAHEGIAIIREEYLELEREVFHGDLDRAAQEAIQLAAMAIRFLVDVPYQPPSNPTDAWETLRRETQWKA